MGTEGVQTEARGRVGHHGAFQLLGDRELPPQSRLPRPAAAGV